MPLKDNPFCSETFISLWSKHFNGGAKGHIFDFLKGPSFYRASFLPLYINIGRNLTKGMDYSLNSKNAMDHKNKVVLLYDIADYFGVDTTIGNPSLGFYAISQYPGFLVELQQFPDFNAYMSATFGKSSRYKLNKYKKRLEGCFNISYQMYHGEIDRARYDHLFLHFRGLLEKRFQDKGITNNNLHPSEWNFYKEVAYPLILKKKASLFVISNGDMPIGITLCYFSENILFDAITVFDIDYEKFHLGSVTIMKLLEWGITNKLHTFDFSKGDFDYKRRWCTKSYSFEYHIFYDRKSLVSRLLAMGIKTYFATKQWLRDREYHVLFHRLIFSLKNLGPKKEPPSPNYYFSETDRTQPPNTAPIALERVGALQLKPAVFEFLYLHTENFSDLHIYSDGTENSYLIFGKNKTKKVHLRP
jgi:hypothetical protein